MVYGDGVTYASLTPAVRAKVDKIVDELADMLDVDGALSRQAASYFPEVYWKYVDQDDEELIPTPMNLKMVTMAVVKYMRKEGL